MPTRVWVTFGPEWPATVAALRAIDERLPEWINDAMEGPVRAAAMRAQAAVMRVEVAGGPTHSTGMRARVAAGVGVRVGPTRMRNGSYFRIYTSMREPDEAIIPRGLDRTAGWRHPLWGNKNYWYTSRPTRPGWFTDTIADSNDEIEEGITRALERAAALVDRAS
jgi:hypothetical protein